ncbi:MAG: YraN family protein [Acidiphilium sp.]|nr:YraN family protein [Acidiphilium sp.]MDD4934977.1 YraN family protein [Acidiphilium sp.]
MKSEKTLDALKIRSNRRRAESKGRNAEAITAAWFETQGYTTLARRLRTSRGELDLIVADASMVIFVEVKARRTARVAAESITSRQQARLIGAAEIALAENADWQRDATRFDVILVVSGAIISIPDAFRPGDLQ